MSIYKVRRRSPYWNFWKVVLAGWMIRYPKQTVFIPVGFLLVLIYNAVARWCYWKKFRRNYDIWKGLSHICKEPVHISQFIKGKIWGDLGDVAQDGWFDWCKVDQGGFFLWGIGNKQGSYSKLLSLTNPYIDWYNWSESKFNSWQKDLQ